MGNPISQANVSLSLTQLYHNYSTTPCIIAEHQGKYNNTTCEQPY